MGCLGSRSLGSSGLYDVSNPGLSAGIEVRLVASTALGSVFAAAAETVPRLLSSVRFIGFRAPMILALGPTKYVLEVQGLLNSLGSHPLPWSSALSPNLGPCEYPGRFCMFPCLLEKDLKYGPQSCQWLRRTVFQVCKDSELYSKL